MTPTDAAKVLAIFATAYGKTVDETAMDLWYQSSLQRCDPDIAAQVAERIVSTDQWFPTPARWNEVRRAVERDRAQPHQALEAAPVSETEKQRVARMIEEARTKLRGGAA